MKRLLCGTLTALFMSLPLYANSPDASTSTTTESMKTETTTPAGEEIQKMEEESSRTESSSVPAESNDAQMQQTPGSDSAIPASEVSDEDKVE